MIINRNRGGGKETVTWYQCPESVRNYLDNVTYNPGDYSTTQINNYAPMPAVAGNTKPIGKTVDGVTYYNEVPNIETPFASENTAGTVKPLDDLRWINSVTINMRDIGGWDCDGGKIKYGKLYRSGAIDGADKNLLVNTLGIQAEIDLRDTEPHAAVLGDSVEYIDVDGTPITYTINDGLDSWKIILRTAFDCAVHNKPLIFHCSAGRDRTGTVACIIEAILGVSQSDIDKDYELTCFAIYVGTNVDPKRTKISWSGNGGLIPMINAKTGSTFRDKVINWVASLGFTATEINAFRSAMIDGYNPQTDDVTPIITNYTITQSLTGIINDNPAVSIAKGKEYNAELTADSGYDYGTFAITMGGANVKESAYEELSYPDKKGRVHIPTVSGDVTITAIGTPKNPYQLCEYIETLARNDGYIDTGYINTEHTGIQALIQFTYVSSSGQGIMGNTDFYIGCASSSDMRALKGGVKSYQLTVDPATYTNYDISLNIEDNGKTYINGVEKNWNAGTPSYTKSGAIYIMKCNNTQSGYKEGAQGRLYAASIYEAGVKMHDFKPAYRTADGICGVMDVLNNVFYPATGSFSHGADVN